jgi:signal transduction histidine kinase
VCEDPRGGLWVGTQRGLNYFSNERFKVFRAEDGLPSNTIWCSYRDRDGDVWIGTRSGLLRVQSGQFRVFTHDESGLSHEDVRAICQDHAGRLWVGTSYGLNLLEGGRFRAFKEAAPGEQFKVVLALHADADGSLWIGTMDEGLFRHRDGRFDHFTTRQGLFDNRIHQILEDERGRLWMSSNRGIFRARKSDLEAVAQGRQASVTCTVFGKTDGLVSVECNGTIQPAGWKSRDGRLWFPTTRGVAVIDPQRVPRNEVPPPVVIENVILDGKPTPRGPRLTVPPGTERLEVHYTGLSFVAPRHVAFRYRLEGFDRTWITNREARVAHYTHLPPAEYRFRVFACNNDGIWNEQEASVAFVLLPFFWETAWFRFLAGLSALGATGLLVRRWAARKHRRELQALERQHALERERTRIARDMHDGLGSNLVKISLLGEIAEAELDRPEAARAHLQKMGTTARETVRDMDEIVWAVNPKNDTVENFANYLCAFAREHFEFTPTRLHLELPAELPVWPLAAEARHNLFLAAREALNNIVKHADATDASLKLELTESLLAITICDNGRGLSPQPGARRGHGQENIRERLAQIGGTLECASEPGHGMTLVMTLPLRPPH